MEKVDGWSIREVLGGGAEGELEVEVDEEVEAEAGEVEQSEEVQVEEDLEPSEGMEALEKLGVTKGELETAPLDLLIGRGFCNLQSMPATSIAATVTQLTPRRTPDERNRYRTGQAPRHKYHPRRPHHQQHDGPFNA